MLSRGRPSSRSGRGRAALVKQATSPRWSMSPRWQGPGSSPRCPPLPGTGRQGSCTRVTSPQLAWGESSWPSWESMAASPPLAKPQTGWIDAAAGACQRWLLASSSRAGASSSGGRGWRSRWCWKKASCRRSMLPCQLVWLQAPIRRVGRPPARRDWAQRSRIPPRWGSHQPPISSIGWRSRVGGGRWQGQLPFAGSSSQRLAMPSGSWRSSSPSPSSRKLPVSRLRLIARQPLPSPRLWQRWAASCSPQPRPRAHQWAPPVMAQSQHSLRPVMAGARQSGIAVGSSLSSWVRPW